METRGKFLGFQKKISFCFHSLLRYKTYTYYWPYQFLLFWFLTPKKLLYLWISGVSRERRGYSLNHVHQSITFFSRFPPSLPSKPFLACLPLPCCTTYNLVLAFCYVVLSCLILSCLVLSRLVLSGLVFSSLVFSSLAFSCLVLSYSCRLLSCLVLPCHALSCCVLTGSVLSCPVLFCLVVSIQIDNDMLIVFDGVM